MDATTKKDQTNQYLVDAGNSEHELTQYISYWQLVQILWLGLLDHGNVPVTWSESNQASTYRNSYFPSSD